VEEAIAPALLPVFKVEIAKLLYPVGELLIIRREGNPAIRLNFGSWERYSVGRVQAARTGSRLARETSHWLGCGGVHRNVQPSSTVFMWKRTA